MSEKPISVGCVVTIDAEKLCEYLAKRDNYTKNMRVFDIVNGKVYITKNSLWYSERFVKKAMAELTSDTEQTNGSRLIAWKGMKTFGLDPKGIEIFPVSAHNLKVVEMSL